jgi:hypothetical protein
MSSTAAFLCIFLSVGLRTEADGWESFVKASDRADNPVIISLIQEYDLNTVLIVLQAVGEREDPYAADILDAVASGHVTKLTYQREYLLRILLESLFNSALPAGTISLRVEANRESLDSLVRAFNGLTDPQLKSVLVKTIELLGGSGYVPVVAGALSDSIQEMENNGGNLSPMRVELLLSLLSYVSRHPSSDFLGICTLVARLSRDARVVERARSISATIASSLR